MSVILTTLSAWYLINGFGLHTKEHEITRRYRIECLSCCYSKERDLASTAEAMEFDSVIKKSYGIMLLWLYETHTL